VVFATVFIHELVQFATRFSEGKSRTNAHESEREWGNITGYYKYRGHGKDMA
jgi:hypothetical protein